MRVLLRISALACAALLAIGCHASRDTPSHDAPSRGSPTNGAQAASDVDLTEAAGVRFIERITGGASRADALPLVVGIHGFGASPENFAAILEPLSIRARVVLPYGLHPVGTGFSWFGEGSNEVERAKGIASAADRLAAMIAEIVRVQPTVGKPLVTGFSQGGMLSFALAVLHPESVRAAFPVGGRLPAPLFPAAWPIGRETPIVRAFHGTADPRVPIDGARTAVRRLKELGLDADLTEYADVPHTTTSEMRHDLIGAITKTIGP